MGEKSMLLIETKWLPKFESIGEGCNHVKPPISIYEEQTEEITDIIATDPQKLGTATEEETGKTFDSDPKIVAMLISGDGKPFV
eukprot:4546286-Ditylum_brightwellii.AAC.2